MGDDRSNIKADGDTFDELNDLRQQLDLEWTPFLETAAEAIRIVHFDGTDGDLDDSEMTLEDIAEIVKSEHEVTRGRVPDETASELAERF